MLPATVLESISRILTAL